MKNCLPSPRHLRSLPAMAVLLGSMLALPKAAEGASVIKQPGLHPFYEFEIEPHMLIAWDNSRWHGSSFGLGARADVPIIQQGPIETINNGMAIGFGLDWAFGGCDNWNAADPNYYDCSYNAIYLPVVLQWNFYMTDIITVFGEPGFVIRHAWASWDYNLPSGTGSGSDSTTDAVANFTFGAKFMFGRRSGLTVRMGYPFLTIGGSFLF